MGHQSLSLFGCNVRSLRLLSSIILLHSSSVLQC
uniref:Uncharacterized protein n=1 Tax=Anguilla anguilla TaxID=7936 RepID=A0A0E9QEW9_ANGAN